LLLTFGLPTTQLLTIPSVVRSQRHFVLCERGFKSTVSSRETPEASGAPGLSTSSRPCRLQPVQWRVTTIHGAFYQASKLPRPSEPQSLSVLYNITRCVTQMLASCDIWVPRGRYDVSCIHKSFVNFRKVPLACGAGSPACYSRYTKIVQHGGFFVLPNSRRL
jgi:hypothetical protein